MAWEKLTEARLEEVLTAYKADIPLGMIREENDFRISVAGAQEKTALLRIGNDWCIPKGITPTTHIIKLPIGEIRQPNATLDLSQSVDNEYYCLLLAKELGLNVPDAEIIKAGRVRALAVERFDRQTSLPTDFPENVVTAVETNVLRLHGRLSREYGIK
ncbi:TPA: type II toxin-antitoxin system HipA family toxin [Escherichia coli]|nr:type II toxin-antitoxin system HipA family toxin [Escherichia coli]EFH3888523.1 type II toxin-antitoxin system HipA family toxin [Escherichia coli]EFI6623932.1 type II toxin-antitoxin system HipA family toxin [Escherichia coli]HAM4315221.1 type II toxin-antitoxin system HipA family toxin [Escherichia coli]HAX2338833.1 type II toxin-antitoxin system HipA family toxin [Escherichia coli]